MGAKAERESEISTWTCGGDLKDGGRRRSIRDSRESEVTGSESGAARKLDRFQLGTGAGSRASETWAWHRASAQRRRCTNRTIRTTVISLI
jgi:hypothetical protein